MTRMEVEEIMLQMGRDIRDIVGRYAPNANHVSLDVIDGAILVRACEWDNENREIIVRDILDAYESEKDLEETTEETA